MKRDCKQAIFAPLKGIIQTTPKAELSGILAALKYGKAPQLIATDHLNHVNAIVRGRGYCCDCDQMGRGCLISARGHSVISVKATQQSAHRGVRSLTFFTSNLNWSCA